MKIKTSELVGPMTTETIHTCSYACERPECIRAQRDELAARLTAAQQLAEGEDINVADIPAVSAKHATLNLQPSSSMQPVATAFSAEKGEVAFRLFDRTLEAMMERIAALLYEETTGQPWTVADVDHHRFARAYYRRLAHKVAVLVSHRKQGGEA